MDTQENRPRLAERMQIHGAPGVDLYLLPTAVDSVVTIEGSFTTYPDFEQGDALLQSLTVALLDKGTLHHTQFEIADALEQTGSEVRFSSEGIRVAFSLRTLRARAAEAVFILAEQLQQPLFSAEAFEKEKARMAAGLLRSQENTAIQADAALRRHLFSPRHPQFVPPVEERLAHLDRLNEGDVQAYYHGHFLDGPVQLVVVGDFDPADFAGLLKSHFGARPIRTAAHSLTAEYRQTEPGETTVSVPGKDNVDVRIGLAVPFGKNDPEYLPFYVGNFILGGNFSSRLMSAVRDEQGLSYGVNSAMIGFDRRHAGYWRTAITLSRGNMTAGIEATCEQIRLLHEQGIQEEELGTAKTTLTGAFQVGLATTHGLARAVLLNAERGMPPQYLDAFPERIESQTVDSINAVLAAHLLPSRLFVVRAGDI